MSFDARHVARPVVVVVVVWVQELYEAGVRRVAVMGVPPLGCAPRVMWERIPARDGGCVEEANELIEAYNGRLAARLDDLRPLLAGADVVFCDVYKGMMEIISNPGTYGNKRLIFTLFLLLFLRLSKYQSTSIMC